MKKVLDLDPASPTTFSQDDLESHWGLRYNSTDGSEVPFWDYLPVGRTHNVVVNHELKYAMAVGSVGGNETIRVRDNLPCKGGLIFLDLRYYSQPLFARELVLISTVIPRTFTPPAAPLLTAMSTTLSALSTVVLMSATLAVTSATRTTRTR